MNNIRNLHKLINKFNLNMDGLTILTEAATGPYVYLPTIMALAGAKQVFCLAKDSKYGSKEDCISAVINIAKLYDVSNKLEPIVCVERDVLNKCDIITNTGFIRPINKSMIQHMKETAVIPLMWEPWEFREEDIDIAECQKKGILVIGTNEHHELLNLFEVNGYLVAKLLFEHGFGLYNNNILLAASGPTGDSIEDFFLRNKIRYTLVTENSELPSNFSLFDAIIVAEHCNNYLIIGRNGKIRVDRLVKENPYIKIIHVCGSIDEISITENGIYLFPSVIAKFGYMSITGDYLCEDAAIELLVAGATVGAIAAKKRLFGINITDTINQTVQETCAMDFDGGYMSFGSKRVFK